MQKIIASYLVQKKECDLPGLGHLKIVTVPVVNDIAGKQILPPSDHVSFDDHEGHLRNDLVEYVALHRHVHKNEAAEAIREWCREARHRLDSGEKIYFDSLGTLQKNPEGEFYFDTENEITLFDPVPAPRVIHKNDGHAVLVGDRETTSGVMNQFLNGTSADRVGSRWKLWAIILFGVALLVLVIHFSTHSFSLSGTGLQSHPTVTEPPTTYELR